MGVMNNPLPKFHAVNMQYTRLNERYAPDTVMDRRTVKKNNSRLKRGHLDFTRYITSIL